MADLVSSPSGAHTPERPSSSHSKTSIAMDLTPRSKIKAMLAALDSDSEQENTTVPKSNLPRTVKNTLEGSESSPAAHTLAHIDSDEEDSDAPTARRGTLAARMRNTDCSEHVERRLLSGPRKHTSPASDVVGSQDAAERTDPLDQALPSLSPGLPSIAETVAVRSTQQRGDGLSEPRPGSPSLFVSPDKAVISRKRWSVSAGSESDNITSSTKPKIVDRLQALSDSRREERLAKERKEDPSSGDELSPEVAQSSDRKSRQLQFTLDDESDGDAEASKRMTQGVRTSRKASKKAIEEMNKETQRMSRNMQLTHEARTRTKFTTEALFTKFNFRQEKSAATISQADQSASALSSSAQPSSDVEASRHHSTPPSSPPSLSSTPPGKLRAPLIMTAKERRMPLDPALAGDSVNGLLSLDDLLRQEPVEPMTVPASAVGQTNEVEGTKIKRASVRRLTKSAAPPAATSDGDELEIIKPRKASRLAILDNMSTIKKRDSHSMHALRALAHISEARKERGKGHNSMTASELRSSLAHRARQQALQERAEKIRKLRERGVLVQSAEEKERDQMQLESMLDRARKEAQDIAKKEKDEAKREGKEGETLPESDEDEDYEASDEEVATQVSGSDDEGDADTPAEVEEDELSRENDGREADDELDEDEPRDYIETSLFENEAFDDGEEEEDGEEEREGGEGLSDEEATGSVHAVGHQRKRLSKRKIVDSDDEEGQSTAAAKQPIGSTIEPVTPAASRNLVAAKSDAFGFSDRKPAPLGLSQVFAGTMAEDSTQETDLDDTAAGSQQATLAYLGKLPTQGLPEFGDSLVFQFPQTVVQDSQMNETPARNNLLSPTIGRSTLDSTDPGRNGQTQVSELPEPTQDDGFQVRDSQPALPIGSYATVDTVLLEDGLDEPSVPRLRKGRLQRRSDKSSLQADTGTMVGDGDRDEELDAQNAPDVFQMMREARAKAAAADNFNKKQSKAKEMVEEQAEESEDEYAGLGGAEDDESQGELDDETRKMIDDQSNEKTNERDIAAYYAEKSRVEDEKSIEKLYKDVINGGLRRKRGAEHDLWDSDDEDEAAARRRAAKQREFAKMRKALLADEKIGKIGKI